MGGMEGESIIEYLCMEIQLNNEGFEIAQQIITSIHFILNDGSVS